MPVGTDLLVISPHLDDAVLSAGGRVAAGPGAVVVTVFAGGHPSPGGQDGVVEMRGDDQQVGPDRHGQRTASTKSVSRSRLSSATISGHGPAVWPNAHRFTLRKPAR